MAIIKSHLIIFLIITMVKIIVLKMLQLILRKGVTLFFAIS